jgi:hypothetical protein
MDIQPRFVRRTVPLRPASIRRGLLSCTVALAATGLVGGLAPAAQAAPADGPDAPVAAPATIEPFATYQRQSTCDPKPKPGTVALADVLLAHYNAGRNGGTVGTAPSRGGVSTRRVAPLTGC